MIERILEFLGNLLQPLLGMVQQMFGFSEPAQAATLPASSAQPSSTNPLSEEARIPEHVLSEAIDIGNPITVNSTNPSFDRISLSNANAKNVHLSFDDGIAGENAVQINHQLLNVLKEHNAKATFFITTDTIDSPEKRELIKRIIREGHEIGVHSTNHDYNLISQSNDAIRNDIRQSRQALESIIHEEFPNYRISLFRPPGGKIHERYQQILAEESLIIAMWDVDTQDYKANSPQEIASAVLGSVRQGRSNVLMHNADLPADDPRFPHQNDRYRGDGREMNVVENVLSFLPQLRSEGYQFSTISEGLRQQGYNELAAGTLIGSESMEVMLNRYTETDQQLMQQSPIRVASAIGR